MVNMVQKFQYVFLGCKHMREFLRSDFEYVIIILV